MTIDAYITHIEGEYENDDLSRRETAGKCLTYPCKVTDEHAQSSHGQPVITIDGRAHGPADLGGFLNLPEERQDLAERLDEAGFRVLKSSKWMRENYDAPVYRGVDEEGLFEDAYADGVPVDFSWMGQKVPGARVVAF
jgi:hypothetical protein